MTHMLKKRNLGRYQLINILLQNSVVLFYLSGLTETRGLSPPCGKGLGGKIDNTPAPERYYHTICLHCEISVIKAAIIFPVNKCCYQHSIPYNPTTFQTNSYHSVYKQKTYYHNFHLIPIYFLTPDRPFNSNMKLYSLLTISVQTKILLGFIKK